MAEYMPDVALWVFIVAVVGGVVGFFRRFWRAAEGM